MSSSVCVLGYSIRDGFLPVSSFMFAVVSVLNDEIQPEIAAERCQQSTPTLLPTSSFPLHTAAREMRSKLNCSRSPTLALGIINISFPPSSSQYSLTRVLLMPDLHREFKWVRKPGAVCITWTYTEPLSHMSMCCVFFSNLYGLCAVIFCKALLKIFLFRHSQKGSFKVLRLDK